LAQALLRNWVYLVSNSALLVTAIVGQLYKRKAVGRVPLFGNVHRLPSK